MHFENEIEIGSQAMVNKGMFARAIVSIWSAPPAQNGVRIHSTHDVIIRYSQQHKRWFPSMPSRQYEATNPQTQQKEMRRQQLVYMFPGQEDSQKASYREWVDQLMTDYFQKCKELSLQPGEHDPNFGKNRPNRGVQAPAGSTPPPGHAPPVAAPAPAAPGYAPPAPAQAPPEQPAPAQPAPAQPAPAQPAPAQPAPAQPAPAQPAPAGGAAAPGGDFPW